MMGRTHAMSGAVAAVAAVAVMPALDRFGVAVDGWSLVAVTVAAAGAAMLPDLDHPHATIAQSLGPVTKGIARVVEVISGGHRHGTHSLLGVAVLAAGTWGIIQAGPVWTGLWLAFLFAIATTAVGVPVHRNRHLHTVLCLGAGVALVTMGALTSYPLGALPWAVGIGAAAHLVGDAATRQGVPMFWPARWRFKFANISTGGPLDTGLSWVLTLALIVQVLWIGSGFDFGGMRWPDFDFDGWL